MLQSLRKLRSRFFTPQAAGRSAAAIAQAILPVQCEMLESRKLLATLNGTVFVDLNNNARVDAGEQGIANVVVTLTGRTAAGANVNIIARTNAQGKYSFTNVVNGTYKVTESQPTGFLDGKDSTGFIGGAQLGNDFVSNIIIQGNVTCTVDFGELKPACVGGTVYVDADN